MCIHIRRFNKHDIGHYMGVRCITTNKRYLEIVNHIDEKYRHSNKKIKYHIFSQGDITEFKEFVDYKDKFILYLDYDLTETYKALILCDILIMSPSALSYSAAFLNEGEKYFPNLHGHRPYKNWIIYNIL